MERGRYYILQFWCQIVEGADCNFFFCSHLRHYPQPATHTSTVLFPSVPFDFPTMDVFIAIWLAIPHETSNLAIIQMDNNLLLLRFIPFDRFCLHVRILHFLCHMEKISVVWIQEHKKATQQTLLEYLLCGRGFASATSLPQSNQRWLRDPRRSRRRWRTPSPRDTTWVL